VTIPDFELRGRLRARTLTSHTPPDSRLLGSGVRLERREDRSGLPPRLQPGAHYTNIVVEHRVVGGRGRSVMHKGVCDYV
jgi:hypothetical protein